MLLKKNVRKTVDTPYWLPLSVCDINPLGGFLFQSAINNALLTKSAFILSFNCDRKSSVSRFISGANLLNRVFACPSTSSEMPSACRDHPAPGSRKRTGRTSSRRQFSSADCGPTTRCIQTAGPN